MKRNSLGIVLAVVVLLGGLLTACDTSNDALYGTVTLTDGSPAGQVTISVLANTSGSTPVTQAVSGLSGGFAITKASLADGTYFVRVDDTQYPGSKLWWTGTGLSTSASQAVGITVNSLNAPPQLAIELDEQVTLHGVLQNAANAAVSGAIVAAEDLSDHVVTFTKTDASGAFNFGIAAPGYYHVAVVYSGSLVPIGPNAQYIPSGWFDIGTIHLPNFATAVAAGFGHSCALRADGSVSCWGLNTSGQLGDGTTTQSLTPVTVQGITNAIAVTTGRNHSCALLADHTVSCWGLEASGQLGNGSVGDPLGDQFSTTPVAVTGISDAIAISAGGNFTCAVLQGGTVSCWGADGFGQLGDQPVHSETDVDYPMNYHSSVPVGVAGVGGAVALSAGSDHACAVLASGSIYCWGDNEYGELGDGSTLHSILGPFTLHQVVGITDAIAVSTGDSHTCALHQDHTVSCWGSGAVGDGTSTQRLTPVSVPGIVDAIAISAGSDSSTPVSCALHETGHVSCWGTNFHGSLGNGTLTPSTSPVEVGSLSDAVAIDVNYAHVCAATHLGGVSCWGQGGDGQLGNNSTNDSTGPSAVSNIP